MTDIQIGVTLDSGRALSRLKEFQTVAGGVDLQFENLTRSLNSTGSAMASLNKQRERDIESLKKMYKGLFDDIAKQELDSINLQIKYFKQLNESKQKKLKEQEDAKLKSINNQLKYTKQVAEQEKKVQESNIDSTLKTINNQLKAYQQAEQKKQKALKETQDAHLRSINGQIKLSHQRRKVEEQNAKTSAEQLKKKYFDIARATEASNKMLKKYGMILKDTEKKAVSFGKMLSKAYSEAFEKGNLMRSAVEGLTISMGSLLRSVRDYLAVSANLASDMLGYRNALQLVSGSQDTAQAALNRAIGIAKALSLDMIRLTKQYSKFMNAITLAGVSVKQADRIFTSFAKAARVMNLDAQRTENMFLALEQMASKGTVSMEELRRQLGDQLPGAMNIAARSMGYSASQLRDFIKAVSQGKVESAELLTKMSEFVNAKVNPLVATSLEKFSARVQALKNEFATLTVSVGETFNLLAGPLIGALADAFKWFNNLIGASNGLAGSTDDNKKAFYDLVTSQADLSVITKQNTKEYDALGETLTNLEEIANGTSSRLASFNNENNKLSKGLKTLLIIVGSAASAFLALKVIVKVTAFVAGFSATITAMVTAASAATTALGALSAAAAAFVATNPILLAVAAAIGVAAGAYYALKSATESEDIVLLKNADLKIRELKDAQSELNQLNEIAQTSALVEVEGIDVEKVRKSFGEMNDGLNNNLQKIDEYNQRIVALQQGIDQNDSFWGNDDETQKLIDDAKKQIDELTESVIKLTKETNLNKEEVEEYRESILKMAEASKKARSEAEQFLKSQDVRDLKHQINLLGKEGLAAEKLQFEYDRLIGLKKLMTKKSTTNVDVENYNNQTAALRPLIEEHYNLKTALEEEKEATEKAQGELKSLSSNIESMLAAKKDEVAALEKGKYALMEYKENQKAVSLQNKIAKLDLENLNAEERERVKGLKKSTAEIIDFGKAVIKIKKQKATDKISDDINKISKDIKKVGIAYKSTSLGDILQKEAIAIDNFQDKIDTLNEKQKEWVKINGKLNPEISKLISELEKGKQVNMDNISEIFDDISEKGVYAFKDWGKEIDKTISKIKQVKSEAESNLEKIAELKMPSFEIEDKGDLKEVFESARSAASAKDFESANKYIGQYIDGLKKLKENDELKGLELKFATDDIERLATRVDGELERIERNAELFVATKMDQEQAAREMDDLQNFLQRMATNNPVRVPVLMDYAQGAINSASSADYADDLSEKIGNKG